MTNQTQSFDAEAIASSFLQTVVVVDDRAHFRDVLPPIASLSIDLEPLAEEPEPHSSLRAPVDDDSAESSHELNAKQLIDAFAARGLVCAVLKPVEGEDIKAATVSAARRSDILVFDWFLDPKKGKTAQELTEAVLSDDSQRQRLRLIAIYTSAPDLAAVASKVGEIIAPYYTDCDLVIHDVFTLAKGPLRIAVFGKPGPQHAHADALTLQRVASEPELPARLVAEFAQLIGGLLPCVATAAIAALRVATHRVLRAFSADMDAAYLAHRMLLQHPESADPQLLPLVGSELRAVIEDQSVADVAGLPAIKAWIDRAHLPLVTAGEILGVTDDVSVKNALKELVEKGATDEALLAKFPALKRDLRRNATPLFADSHDVDESNYKFAELTTVRHRYGGSRPPQLTLGTVLFDGQSYWLCLLPKCDSTRLKQKTPFPLLKLTDVTEPDGAFHVIVRHRGGWHRLNIPKRIGKLQMVKFKPGAYPPGEVTANVEQGSLTFASDSPNPRYEWVADLKDEYAQRTANEFAAFNVRVGLDDFEWIRRSRDKQPADGEY